MCKLKSWKKYTFSLTLISYVTWAHNSTIVSKKWNFSLSNAMYQKNLIIFFYNNFELASLYRFSFKLTTEYQFVKEIIFQGCYHIGCMSIFLPDGKWTQCRAHSKEALIAKDFIVRNLAEQLGWDQNVFEIRVQVGMKMLLLN